MFKNFLLRRMMKAKGASDQQVDVILKMVEKNPALFQKIAAEIEAKVKAGQSQEQATMAVMMAHQEEIRKLM